MKQEDQTEQIKLELFKYTELFTKSLIAKKFRTLRGKEEDLAAKFYSEFLTAKSRNGNDESLLDKWDPNKLTLPALVKISVNRMLIDTIRKKSLSEVSMDADYDEDSNSAGLEYVAYKQNSKESPISVDTSSESLKKARANFLSLPLSNKEVPQLTPDELSKYKVTVRHWDEMFERAKKNSDTDLSTETSKMFKRAYQYRTQQDIYEDFKALCSSGDISSDAVKVITKVINPNDLEDRLSDFEELISFKKKLESKFGSELSADSITVRSNVKSAPNGVAMCINSVLSDDTLKAIQESLPQYSTLKKIGKAYYIYNI